MNFVFFLAHVQTGNELSFQEKKCVFALTFVLTTTSFSNLGQPLDHGQM
jgi:hypothetical protein